MGTPSSELAAKLERRRLASEGGLVLASRPSGGVAAPGVAAPGVAAPGVAAPGVAAPGVAAPGVAAPGVAAPGVAAPGVAAPGASAMRPSISVTVVPGGPSVSLPVPKAPVGKALSSTAMEVDAHTHRVFVLFDKKKYVIQQVFFFWFHRCHGVLKTQVRSAHLEPFRWNTTSQGCGVYSGL